MNQTAQAVKPCLNQQCNWSHCLVKLMIIHCHSPRPMDHLTSLTGKPNDAGILLDSHQLTASVLQFAKALIVFLSPKHSYLCKDYRTALGSLLVSLRERRVPFIWGDLQSINRLKSGSWSVAMVMVFTIYVRPPFTPPRTVFTCIAQTRIFSRLSNYLISGISWTSSQFQVNMVRLLWLLLRLINHGDHACLPLLAECQHSTLSP